MGRYRKDSPSLRKPSPSGADHEDDTALWKKVTQSVTELPSRQQAVCAPDNKPGPSEPAARKPEAGQPARTFSVAVPSQKPDRRPADLRLGDRSGIDRSNARRLQRGQMTIDDRLDLHGLSQDQAHQQLTAFISRAVQQQMRHVLVITGKGRAGQGVLRQQVPVWLKQAPLAAYINAISHAQPQDGGTGALYIRLKRQRGEIR